MSSGFGNWQYKDGNQGDGGGSSVFGSILGGGGSGGGGEDGEGQTLPLFTGSGLAVPENMSWGSLKENLQAQMPQKVLGMNYQQRFKVFCALLVLSGVFFALAFTVGLSLIYVRPQKFALSFTFGSLTFMGSFGILRGPYEHFSGMFTAERIPFTTMYLGSMFATLYFTFSVSGVKGYAVVMACSGAQLLALLWYLITFLPGGAAGMQVLTKAIVTLLKPILVGCTKCWAAFAAKAFGWMTREQHLKS
uniref:Vesicle transport protein n=1 Tax=Pseudictyota dubia TaxID=2749911 RepID=A0A7R9Z7D6_9STRA|mmetsp:Transcript_27248/g.50472  ORF Transcript_27248/g.50472 Transcript_27248/m.50472 type:complete len:248 (+) Transcript_27248:325-1068(+)